VPDDLPAPLRALVDVLGPASVAYILGLVEPVWSEDVGRLRRAVTDGAEEAIRDAAHKVKGSAGMFGFAELAAAAETIERSAARGTGLTPELAVLEVLVGETLQRVRAWVAALD
jgi:HPt (histidine-containing phosphotransfer) domain-containing protein